MINKEKRALKKMYRAEFAVVAKTVKKVLEDAMVEGEPSRLKDLIYSYEEATGLRVSVMSRKGTILAGSARIPFDITPSLKEMTFETKEDLLFLLPLKNTSRCFPCHGSDHALRGAIAVEISKAPLNIEIRKTTIRTILFIGLMMIIAYTGVFILLRRKIISPLAVLREGVIQLKQGNLDHRITLTGRDELSEIADTINSMAESIQKTATDLERRVEERTRELRVIAALSPEVFREDLTDEQVLRVFGEATTERLGYVTCTVYILDTHRRMLRRRYHRGKEQTRIPSEVPLDKEGLLQKVFFSAEPEVLRDTDLNTLILPLLSPLKRCYEINSCRREDCPAHGLSDIRCWLLSTYCENHRPFRKDQPVLDCLFCEAFPVMGLLLLSRDGEIEEESMQSMEILASEMASSLQNLRMLRTQHEHIQKLQNLQEFSIETLQWMDPSIIAEKSLSEAVSFFSADAAILYHKTGDDTLRPYYTSTLKDLPPISSVHLETEDGPLEIYDVSAPESLKGFLRTGGYRWMVLTALKSHNRTEGYLCLMQRTSKTLTGYEKALLRLFCTQVASALSAARIYTELKHEKELSEAMFNSAATGVMLLDEEGRILKLNRAALEIFHVSEEEVINRHIGDLYPECTEMLAVSPESREIEIKTQKGRRTIGFTTSQISYRETEKGFIVLFRDISEIKRLQMAIRRKQHLEALGRIISGVAHEVRNPLFAIQSIAQIIEKETESPTHQLLIQTLLKETARMKRLVDDLLFYSRPSKIETEEIPLEGLFRELVQYVRTKNYALNIRTNTDPSLTLKGDRDRLMQVFRNLLDNSIEASASEITLSARKTEEGVLVEVQDNGEGIGEDDLEKVFDLFFTTKKEGTGLGLSICRKIIEDHNGEIEIDSERGKGTRVRILFRPS